MPRGERHSHQWRAAASAAERGCAIEATTLRIEYSGNRAPSASAVCFHCCQKRAFDGLQSLEKPLSEPLDLLVVRHSWLDGGRRTQNLATKDLTHPSSQRIIICFCPIFSDVSI